MDEKQLLTALETFQNALQRFGTESLALRLLLQHTIGSLVMSREDPKAALDGIRQAALDTIDGARLDDSDSAVAMDVRAGIRKSVLLWLQELESSLPR